MMQIGMIGLGRIGANMVRRLPRRDQWGVELGKVLAQRILSELDTKTGPKL